MVTALEPADASSNCAFGFNLRRYRLVMPGTVAAPARHERAHSRINADYLRERGDIERDASMCVRRHQALALPPV